MKTVKRLFAALLAIALIVLIPGAGSITASADDPATFTVKYVASMGEWRVQKLAKWDDSRETGGMDYLWRTYQDGDSVVIIGTDGGAVNLTFDRALANLTLYNVGATSLIFAEKDIKEVYVLKGTAVALNGYYENVYVYDDCVCNINQNAKNVYIAGESKMTMNVAANGAVEFCQITNLYGTQTKMYNIKADSLRVIDGQNETDPQTYSTSPDAAPAAPAAPSAPAAPAPNGSVPTSPQTGETSSVLLLLGAAICFAGSMYFRRRAA